MANRVPLIVDTTNLHLKELPLGDALDLTGCGIVGLTSFTPGTGGGFRFVGVTTFGMGVGIATVFVNDGLIANYLRATNLTDNRVVTAGAGGTLTDSSDLTYDGTTLAVTGAITASTNLTVNGNVDLGNAATDSITPTGRFDAHIIPLTDGAVDLGASGVEFKDLYIDGTANIDALIADTAKISDITDNHVVIGGSAGELEGSSNLTFDGSTLTVVGDIAVSGNLNYTNVTDIYSVGIITAAKGIQIKADGLNVEAGISTFAAVVDANDTTQSTSTTTGAAIFSGGVGITKNVCIGGITELAGLDVISGVSTFAGAVDANSTLDVASTSQFNDDVTLVSANGNNIVFDKTDNALEFGDSVKATFGGGKDLQVYYTGSAGWIYQSESAKDVTVGSNAGNVWLRTGASANDDAIKCSSDLDVSLYFDNARKFATSGVGASVYGTGALKIPVGTTGERPTTGDSPQNGDIRYNTSLSSYEGYGNGSWGGLGGGTEIDVSVSSTSATNLTTFAKADYRSASLRIQIVQGSAYQIGRYLMIHDGTTATIVEEAAIATGSMLGTISAAINSANAEIKVTMGSASSATVTTIIDKITV